MEEIRRVIGNAKMAYSKFDPNINSKEVVNSIFNILNEAKEDILKVNQIDVKNNNGFNINFEVMNTLKEDILIIEDVNGKVINMQKDIKNNYITGTQLDSLGTICILYDANTYTLLELALKAILTGNSIILTSNKDFMKGTNELILILIRRILSAYNIDENLIQILYTANFEGLLSNSASINKVIVIGNKSFQNEIKRISKIEVIAIGYNNYDIYIEDLTNLALIEKIVEFNNEYYNSFKNIDDEDYTTNLDIYVKEGLDVPFTDIITVYDIEEAIAQINFNSSKYSSSIFTNNSINASMFLKGIKSESVFVNSSPLLAKSFNIDTNMLLTKKNMYYPNPLKETSEKNKIEFPTMKSVLENAKISELEEKISKIEEEKTKLKEYSIKAKNNIDNINNQVDEKTKEVEELKRQLSESHIIANKYMNIFRNSMLSRIFSGLKQEDLDNDTKMLS